MADQTKSFPGVKPGEKTLKTRRIVTGHDKDNKAVFVEDQICPHRFALGGCENFVVTELWRINESPADIAGEYQDTTDVPFALNPAKSGNVFRIIEFPPNGELGMKEDGVTPEEPTKHRTASIDYAIILEGECYAVLDEEETLMKKGDVLIQRGTVHSWSNRSDKSCIILFVLCDAAPVEGMEYK